MNSLYLISSRLPRTSPELPSHRSTSVRHSTLVSYSSETLRWLASVFPYMHKNLHTASLYGGLDIELPVL